MSTVRAAATAVIPATPAEVYAILTDYRHAHPSILPKPYFADLKVVSGGQGAGTVLQLRMNVLGNVRDFYETVTEPEPGRRLVETDIYTGQTSTFIVEPTADGQQSRVTIATEFAGRPGFAGLVERLLTPPITRHIFRKELANLAEFARAAHLAGGGEPLAGPRPNPTP